MGPGDTIGLIAVSGMIIGVIAIFMDAYKRRLAFKERELELFASQTAEKAAQYAAQAERLEQRVQVLERLATDKSSNLAAEIEDLRSNSVN